MFFRDSADKCHFFLSFLSNATFNINEHAIESRHSKELFEIAIDSNLTFEEHVKRLCRKSDQEFCVKSVRILSFSGTYLPVFGMNTERYGLFLRIQSKYGKIRTRKTQNTDTFHAVKLHALSKLLIIGVLNNDALL